MFDLDTFFGTPGESMLYLGQYDPLLVGLSIAIAIFAAYAALLVSEQLTTAGRALRRPLWLGAGGLCLGLGIWAMHFVGMLAFTLPCSTSYNAGITFLSTIPGMLASTLALHVISQGPPHPRRLWGGGALLGAGIGAMHYTGMAAMEFSGMIRYDLRLFAVSIAVAVVLATAALWLKFRLARLQGRWRPASPLWGAIVLGLAVAGMHYTAMAAAHFVRGDEAPSGAQLISPSALAALVLGLTGLLIVVTIVATYVGKRRLFSMEHSYRLVAGLILAWSATAWLGSGYMQQRHADDTYRRELQLAREQAGSAVGVIEQNLVRLQGLALMLARDADMVRTALAHPPAPGQDQAARRRAWQADPQLQRMNAALAHSASALKVDAMFVLNAEGDCIVTNNAATAGDYVGHNFADRDYFSQARAAQQGQQFGMSRNGKQGGLYFAQAILSEGRFIGVAVVKLHTAALAPLTAHSQAWLVDAHGVIIHAGAPAWQMAALPAAPAQALSLQQRRQRYARDSFATLPMAASPDRATPFAVGLGRDAAPHVLAHQAVPGKLALSMYIPRALPSLQHQGARRFWLFMLVGLAGNVLIVAAAATMLYLREKQKADADLRVAATAFESREGMAITDAANVVLRINRAYTDITGFDESDLLDRPLCVGDPASRDAAFLQQIWAAVAANGAWQGELWQRRKDGLRFPCGLVITAVRNGAGAITHHVCALTDITERKQSEQEIRKLALYDFLTQLPNRRCLVDRLQHALAGSKRSGQYGALLFIDLDNFKDLNDTLGHHVGDQLLQQVARRFVSCVRDCDTVARLGGDEFVIMLENLSGDPALAAEQARSVGAKLLARQAEPYTMGQHQHSCTSSVGIAVFRADQASVEELLKQTDLAMYQAKARGRNTMCFFDPDMQTVVSTCATLDNDLRLGLAMDQFQLYYQPQVDADGAVTGAEALLRWRHPVRGMVPPVQFIGAAEASGLILPLGAWVLREACAQLLAWNGQAHTAHLSLAVNVSPRQFHQPDFVERVMATLAASGADPRRLKLELTEGVLLDDVETSIAKMAQLNALGIGISLDDFGTGYSSLAYLKRLPLCQLKIDRSFVCDILSNPHDAAITRTILTLAESMGLSAIAEGVESEGQQRFLASQGCRYFQGYLFGMPQPAPVFERMLGPLLLARA